MSKEIRGVVDMNNVISSIILIDPSLIRFHESYENVRLENICRSIELEGSLRNPPIVSSLGNGEYLLLDGAHRITAMIALSCQRVAVQVVSDEQVGLDVWDHLVPMGKWWDLLKQERRINWSNERIEERLLAQVTEADGRVHYLYQNQSDESLFASLDAWHRIVGLYQHKYFIRRVPHCTVTQPGNEEVLLSYPEYTLEELKWIVQSGRLMPAGVTRCMVQGRILNLNIPLELLRADHCQEEEWERLCRSWSKRLRYYTELIYMCE